VALGVFGLLVALMLAWGGVGFFGGLHYDTTVEIVATPPTPTSSSPAPPASTPTAPLPCPKGTPGPVNYYANDPLASQYNDFGVPLIASLPPLFEPSSTPQPDVQQVVAESWSRLCQDPALARAVVAAAFPTWEGLHTAFDWQAALQLLAQGDWSSATMVYHAQAPTPWTMSMVASPTGGAPETLIVHAPFGGWYLVVRFGDHELLLRPGCGDQPVLDEHGYQAPLFTLFTRA
jgi:hypothetical protein